MTAADNLQPRQFGDYTLSHRTEDQGERKPRHVIEAHEGAEKVGEMNYYGTTGTIKQIYVAPEHARQGIATAMWDMGQAGSPKPKHSAARTNSGEAWSKSVGGRRPRRVRA